MSKYSFDRLGSDRFEHLAQALLEKPLRHSGCLIQFGDGKDGAREATWTQHPSHADYSRPRGYAEDVPKEWVFQVKYHDLGLRGWAAARAEVESELNHELEKLINKYKVTCHKFVLITNVPFTGVRHVGTRDKVNSVKKQWLSKVPEIEVWDAVDLSRMLDADPGTRTTFLGDILPGDVMQALLGNLNFNRDRRTSVFNAYLKSLLRSEQDTKAEEAGDESGLRLEKIFIDLNLTLINDPNNSLATTLPSELRHSVDMDESAPCHMPAKLEQVPSSFAMIRAGHRSMLLKGGPGVGKSTITQFLTLYHAARLVQPDLAVRLARRLTLTGGVTADQLDAHSRIRFPLRIELRRYAQWMSDPKNDLQQAFLAKYIAERISHSASSLLEMEDIFFLAHENPILLILDGLDEVPNPDMRRRIFCELQTFLTRCESESSDIQILLSSRPQGYRGEFDGFDPIEWHVAELGREMFIDYTRIWLQERIPDVDERNDALRRIEEGMQSPSVQKMATTLLQATVMLTIVRRKHAIPHARHKLYNRYVEVIFEREQNKQTVRERGDALLRLHELVGFTIIRKMEMASGNQTLEGEEFSQCVHQVIKDYGSSEIGSTSIGTVVESIVTQAKDRLCLLSGKGENQQDVDFAIQQFREYFAAAYLARHEDADPERVYYSLALRSSVWIQVLRFYVAFQSQAQQKNWITEADCAHIDLNNYRGVVEATRIRRTLLRVLPEFERPKNEYTRRAIRNLFEVRTRWIWHGRNSTWQCLQTFAAGDAFTLLADLFNGGTVDDTAALNVELNLLCSSAAPGNIVRLQSILKDLLPQVRCQSAVIWAAFVNNVPLSAHSISAESIMGAIQFLPHRQEAQSLGFISALSDDQKLDVTYLEWEYGFWLAEAASTSEMLRELNKCLDCDRSEISQRAIGCNFSPFTIERRHLVSDKILSQLENSHAQVAPYLSALLRAIRNPHDPTYYAEAKRQHGKLQRSVASFVSVTFQLGPDPEDYESMQKWIEARDQCINIGSDARSDVLSLYCEVDPAWILLYAHPDTWSIFESILTHDRLQKIVDKYANTVRAISPRGVWPAHIYEIRSIKSIDPGLLCECFITIIEEYGRNLIQDVPLFLQRTISTELDVHRTNRLLHRAIALEDELSSAWAEMVVIVCSGVPGVDVTLLVELWKKHQLVLTYLNQFPSTSSRATVIEKALGANTPDATSLAAFLSCRSDQSDTSSLEPSLAARVTKQLCEFIGDADVLRQSVDISLLLHQRVHPVELYTWQQCNLLDQLRARPWQLDRVGSRILEIARGVEQRDYELVHQALRVFIENRSEYPIEVSLAALEAVLRMDENAASPLSSRDWQRA